MFANAFMITFVSLMLFATHVANGQNNSSNLKSFDDKDDVILDPDTEPVEASRITKRLLNLEKYLSPKKEIRFPYGSLWDKKSSIDERLTDLRGRSILENWIRWPTDLTGNLNNERRELVRAAFQRRALAQDQNFDGFEQAKSAVPQADSQKVEKLLKELVDKEARAEQSLVSDLDDILPPEHLAALVKEYMKHPLIPFLASPLGKLYLDMSDAQFLTICELSEKQARLHRISNISTEKEEVQYAQKQVPLLGIQTLAVLTEHQVKKYWDLLPGADPRLSFDEALAKRPAEWRELYLDYVKALKK